MGPSSTSEVSRLSQIIAPLSYALDLAEGQPQGHALRTTLIGMRLAREIYLLPKQRAALFFTLLLKDLGTSANASQTARLFGIDDRLAKSRLKSANWTKPASRLGFALRSAAAHRGILSRIGRFMKVARANPTRQLLSLRSDRGAFLARTMLLPEETATALAALDEHWNGRGHPSALAGEEIPTPARIVSLAETVEIFFRQYGLDAALDMARDRSGTSFDPNLVRALASCRQDSTFWNSLYAPDLLPLALAAEPSDCLTPASDDRLDGLAETFAHVIDAKSFWTFKHSHSVALLAAGIAHTMNLPLPAIRQIRRAALLHDIGKLAISSLILDKPGRLDPAELAAMRKHPYYTRQILCRVPVFNALADLAAAHHERLDGTGYDRGLSADQIPLEARILTLSDTFEALASRRPYREDLSEDQLLDILSRNLNSALDPACFQALQAFLATSEWEPIELAA
jgi:HD-GYP domain-containing protein (c-di-GMP phosphodiesterase class II)